MALSDGMGKNTGLPLQASEAVTTDLFAASSANLLSDLKNVHNKKLRMMEEVKAKLGARLEAVEPISEEELQPFIDALIAC